MVCLRPVGPTNLRELDASVGGVRTTRLRRTLQHLSSKCCWSLTDRSPPCDRLARKTLPRAPHPHPASV